VYVGREEFVAEEKDLESDEALYGPCTNGGASILTRSETAMRWLAGSANSRKQC